MSSAAQVLEALVSQIEQRRSAHPETSYVASLHVAGADAILQKLGEEAIEVVVAAKNMQRGGSDRALVHEVADMWFHSLVLLSNMRVSFADVLDELESRMGRSGIEEKRARKRKPTQS